MQKFWTFLFDTGRNLDLYFKKRKKEKDWSNWLKIFKNTNTMDHNLSEMVKIRLYKDSILSKCIYQGFEQTEIEFICKYLTKDDVFFDIGSNMGLFSLYASEPVGNKGKIYAFEPTKGIYKRLTENVELNGIKNITTINKGLSDKKGILNLNISDNGHDAWNSFAKISDEYYKSTENVEVTTLDLFVEENGIKEINLIKLDVEGWELFVLKGGESIIKKSPNTVLLVEFTEENTFAAGYYVHEIYDLLVHWGYKWFSYSGGEIHEEKRRLHYPYNNFIATKDIELVKKRIKAKD